MAKVKFQANDDTLSTYVEEMVRLDETEGLLKSSFRTLALFEHFADVQKPQTLGEICQGLNIPQSSASTLIKSLVDSGFLTRNPDSRTYLPSIRLSYLGHWISGAHPQRTKLTLTAEKLQKAVGETVVIAMQNGIYSQYVFVSHTDKTRRRHVETGSLRPLVCSATGWALLIYEDDKEIGKLIRRTQAETDNLYWGETARDALKHIYKARSEKYAYASGPAQKGTAGIAIRITPRASHPALVIGVAGSVQNIADKKNMIIDQLMDVKPFTPDAGRLWSL